MDDKGDRKPTKAQNQGSTSKSKASEELVSDLCYVYKKSVCEIENAKQCKLCESWLHIKCIVMSKKVYDMLNNKNLTNVHWYSTHVTKQLKGF